MPGIGTRPEPRLQRPQACRWQSPNLLPIRDPAGCGTMGRPRLEIQMMRCVAVLLLILPMLAQAKPAGELWFSVLLDGRKIGSFVSSRSVDDKQVTTYQHLQVEFDRAGTRIALGSSETNVETTDGKPLAFTSVSSLGGSDTRIEGTVADGSMQLRIGSGDSIQQRVAPWPSGALMAEGLRLASLRVPLESGQSHAELAFQAASLDAIEVTSTIGPREKVSLPGGDKNLFRIDQVFSFSGTPVRNTAWIDGERDIHKLTMPAIGVDLTLIECGKPCATAPNQDTNIFERTLMPAPRALGEAELSGSMRYTLSPRADGAPLVLPETSEQSTRIAGREIVVDVHADARAGFGGSPEPADRMPNDWLQSAAPEIVDMAIKATRHSRSDAERMHALEAFVSGYISDKNLGVGYASALQVARNPQGDCTEHAVLLAALGRALGIATRVVDGLAYAPGFAGNEHVFVPHAWIHAWIDGRWQSFDAALGGFDAGHIAFSSGDGDPWRFYQGLDLLGRIDLKHVEAFETRSTQ